LTKQSEYIKQWYAKYPWKKHLNKAKQRCNNPKCDKYQYYGGRGIQCLITKGELRKLWVRDKAYKMKKPSLDRIKKNKHYEYSNCCFIEQSLNSSKDKYKKVNQYDLNGKFIKEWSSLQEIELNLPCSRSSLIKCLKGRIKKFKGFKWEYKL
jgi:hypothetical protein